MYGRNFSLQRPVRIVRKERDIAAFEDEDKEKERGGKKKKEEKDNRDTEKELGDDTDAEVSEIMDDSEACQGKYLVITVREFILHLLHSII